LGLERLQTDLCRALAGLQRHPSALPHPVIELKKQASVAVAGYAG
jgi:hypothetical protein